MQLLKKAILGLVSLHMLAWLVMLIAFAGIVFLAVGVYGLLTTALAPWAAALIVGAILLLLVTIIVLLVAIMALREQKKPKKQGQRPQAGHDRRLEEELETAFGEQATQWARDNTGLAMLGATAIGLLLATNRESRKAVCDAARPVATRKVMDIIRRLSRSD